MLNLNSQECLIAHVNFRTEKHGEDDVTAVDLKLQASMPPSILEQLVPGMVEHFFQQANSSGAMKGEKALRFPDLENTFKVKSDIPGYKIAIEWGMSGKIVEFADCEVGKIAVELIEGGAVNLTCRVQVGGDPEDLARLVPLLNLSLPVSLTPPAEQPLPPNHPDNQPGNDSDGEQADPFAGSDLAANPPENITSPPQSRKRRNGAAAEAH